MKNIVVVGDPSCGKTRFVTSFIKDDFNDNPSTENVTYVTKIKVGGKEVEFNLWDTAGDYDYIAVRRLSYETANLILLCFDIGCPESFANILQQWMPELRKYCPKKPIILVGNKKDLRNDLETIEELAKTKKKPVSASDGRRLCKIIAASAYLECSGKFPDGDVDSIFEMAVGKLKKNKRGCVVSFRKL